ncbi:MAG: hypothetical protein ABIY50_10795 [Ignavibacteria bacterium]
MNNYGSYIRSFFALLILVMVMLSCSKLSELSSGGDASKLYFCEKYVLNSDECEGKSTKYSPGRLTVMVDIRPTKKKLGVESVNINVTDIKSGEVVETFPFDTKADMDYVYFEDVNFKKAGKYKVSALKPDGTVIVTNEIEIVDN